MTPSRRFALALCLTAAGLCQQGCKSAPDFGFKVDLGLAQWAVDGDVALEPSSGGGVGGRDNDFGDSLGFEDWRTSPYVRLEAYLEKTSLSIATLFYDERASGRLQNPFGDLPAGQQVTTESSLTSVRLALHRQVYHRGPITISPGIGIHYFDADLRVRSPLSEQRVEVQLPFPSVYLKSTAELGPLIAELNLGYGGMVLVHDKGTVGDIETFLRWHPIPLLELFAGYRFAFYDIEGESDAKAFSSDFVLHGWIVGFKVGP